MRRSSLGSAGITRISHFLGPIGSGEIGRASKRKRGRGARTSPKRPENGRCDTGAGALFWADAAVAPIATAVTIIAAVHRCRILTSSPAADGPADNRVLGALAPGRGASAVRGAFGARLAVRVPGERERSYSVRAARASAERTPAPRLASAPAGGAAIRW